LQLQYNFIHIRFVVGDLSFLSAVIGHYGAFHGMFRSPLCEATTDDFDTPTDCRPRELEDIRLAAELFNNKWTNSIKGKAQTTLFKETKGIRSPPLMNIPLCNYVPSPFHCVQGMFCHSFFLILQFLRTCQPHNRRIGVTR
jgi:hypothetical protein